MCHFSPNDSAKSMVKKNYLNIVFKSYTSGSVVYRSIFLEENVPWENRATTGPRSSHVRTWSACRHWRAWTPGDNSPWRRRLGEASTWANRLGHFMIFMSFLLRFWWILTFLLEISGLILDFEIFWWILDSTFFPCLVLIRLERITAYSTFRAQRAKKGPPQTGGHQGLRTHVLKKSFFGAEQLQVPINCTKSFVFYCLVMAKSFMLIHFYPFCMALWSSNDHFMSQNCQKRTIPRSPEVPRAMATVALPAKRREPRDLPLEPPGQQQPIEIRWRWSKVAVGTQDSMKDSSGVSVTLQVLEADSKTRPVPCSSWLPPPPWVQCCCCRARNSHSRAREDNRLEWAPMRGTNHYWLVCNIITYQNQSIFFPVVPNQKLEDWGLVAPFPQFLIKRYFLLDSPSSPHSWDVSTARTHSATNLVVLYMSLVDLWRVEHRKTVPPMQWYCNLGHLVPFFVTQNQPPDGTKPNKNCPKKHGQFWSYCLHSLTWPNAPAMEHHPFTEHRPKACPPLGR